MGQVENDDRLTLHTPHRVAPWGPMLIQTGVYQAFQTNGSCGIRITFFCDAFRFRTGETTYTNISCFETQTLTLAHVHTRARSFTLTHTLTHTYKYIYICLSVYRSICLSFYLSIYRSIIKPRVGYLTIWIPTGRKIIIQLGVTLINCVLWGFLEL